MTEPALSRTVLYNEHLTPPNNTTTVPDTPDGHLSGETLIDQKVGWHWAPVEPEARPGEQPEPVTFVPVVPEPEPDSTPKPKTGRGNKPKEGSD